MLDPLRTELAHALRRLARSPGLAVAVVLSLAVGIGADVTMLGLADSLLFRAPEHVRDVHRVVDIRARTYPDYVALRDQTRSFSGVAAWYAPPRPYALTEGDRVAPVQQMLASASLFPVLGVRPVLGRFFDAAEDRPGGPHLAVLGYDLWQNRFGGARDVLGHTLRVAGDVYTIIGVAPEGFTGVALSRIDLFLPITTTRFDASSDALTSRNYFWLRTVARLAPGATLARARADARLVFDRANPTDSVPNWRTSVYHGRPGDVQPVMALRRELATSSIPVALWLAGVATAVLLIACANVAGLLLARAVRGRRELAVRAALGASRARLMAAPVIESVLLAVGGGLVALVAAHWAGAILRGFVLTDVAPITSAFDPRLMAIALALTALTTLLCGAGPAWSAARGDLSREMASGARTASAPHLGVRRALLVSQLALAMALVVGATLFVRSLRDARALDLGMSLDHVLISDLDLQGAGYTPERAHALVDPLLERLRAIPGVRAAALSDASVQPSWITYAYSVPGLDSLPRVLADSSYRGFSAVTPSFLATIGTPIVEGRDFTDADRAARVIIVSRSLARLYWPHENPIGRCMKVGTAKTPCATVIGVARDRRSAPGDTTVVREAFVPLGSPAEPANLANLFPLGAVALRVDGNPMRVAPVVQRVLQEMLPGAPFIRVRPALTMFDRALRAWRLGASMFSAFGAIALGLAILGVYAAIAYLVTQRMREIAIRVALGATTRDVLRLVIGEALRAAAIGVALGLVISALLAHGVRAMLFGISPVTPVVYIGAACALALTAVLASAIPARRAIALDPMITLRDD